MSSILLLAQVTIPSLTAAAFRPGPCVIMSSAPRLVRILAAALAFLSATQATPHVLPHRSRSPGLRFDGVSDHNILGLSSRGLPTGTCNANTPCENAACCGTNGLCGYSPTECGVGNCTSNCDAKAECGQYGKPGTQKCPLGVCCSQFGYVDRCFSARACVLWLTGCRFCGSTNDFCDAKKGCQKVRTNSS